MLVFPVLLVIAVAVFHWRGTLWFIAGCLAFWLLMTHPLYGIILIALMLWAGHLIARSRAREAARVRATLDAQSLRLQRRQADLNAEALVRRLSTMSP